MHPVYGWVRVAQSLFSITLVTLDYFLKNYLNLFPLHMGSLMVNGFVDLFPFPILYVGNNAVSFSFYIDSNVRESY